MSVFVKPGHADGGMAQGLSKYVIAEGDGTIVQRVDHGKERPAKLRQTGQLSII